MNVSQRRPYRAPRRAEKAEATGERILDAAVSLFWEQPTEEISLDALAQRAGVTVQTVIRRFGNRAGIFTAAVAREHERVTKSRSPADVGNEQEAVRQLVDHYEEMGDRVIRLLAEEGHMPELRRLTDAGRLFHRNWCEQVFSATLAALRGAERARRRAQLASICDVYTWKLLRRDARLSRRQTELALVEMLTPLLEGS